MNRQITRGILFGMLAMLFIGTVSLNNALALIDESGCVLYPGQEKHAMRVIENDQSASENFSRDFPCVRSALDCDFIPEGYSGLHWREGRDGSLKESCIKIAENAFNREGQCINMPGFIYEGFKEISYDLDCVRSVTDCLIFGTGNTNAPLRYYCIGLVASQSNDLSICEDRALTEKTRCLHGYAIGALDISICDKSEKCQRQVGSYLAERKCSALEDYQSTEECYKAHAGIYKESELCNRLLTNESREDCINFVALTTKDPLHCTRIDNESVGSCIENACKEEETGRSTDQCISRSYNVIGADGEGAHRFPEMCDSIIETDPKDSCLRNLAFSSYAYEKITNDVRREACNSIDDDNRRRSCKFYSGLFTGLTITWLMGGLFVTLLMLYVVQLFLVRRRLRAVSKKLSFLIGLVLGIAHFFMPLIPGLSFVGIPSWMIYRTFCSPTGSGLCGDDWFGGPGGADVIVYVGIPLFLALSSVFISRIVNYYARNHLKNQSIDPKTIKE